ncbi:enoyl-CoA delta isomerase 1, peroxisomal-like [Euphorbia lathyris]|uniref:enoyl-CoA delta isomerase 1, peroxisomal-like n=1 Tax=Euphorbia lathyris TaxID=212925 RepID=UPI00331314F6
MCSLEKRGNIHILTLTGPGEHRLSSDLLDSLRSALRHLRSQPASPSSVLITTAHGKFFSNGYDLAWAQSATSPSITRSRFKFLSSEFRALISDLISLPMPTIAAVTGHASAGGFILALAHDYVLMRKDRGFLYMSELDIGLVIPAWFMAFLKCKIGNPSARRDVVLRAAKLTAAKAVESGIVHSVHDGAEATVDAAVELGKELERRKWDGHVYAKNRLVVLGEVVDKIGFDETVEGQNGDKTVSKM